MKRSKRRASLAGCLEKWFRHSRCKGRRPSINLPTVFMQPNLWCLSCLPAGTARTLSHHQPPKNRIDKCRSHLRIKGVMSGEKAINHGAKDQV